VVGKVSRLQGALLELGKDFSRILLARKTVHDFQLREFNVNRVIVFAKEDLHIVLEHRWSSLNDEKNVSQGDVLNFRSGRE
jgi:predicted nuclease of restriction endonuclease-like (RecB) superfamily